jgi:hypothetical protein
MHRTSRIRQDISTAGRLSPWMVVSGWWHCRRGQESAQLGSLPLWGYRQGVNVKTVPLPAFPPFEVVP